MSSKLTELVARYAQSVRGKAAAEAKGPKKPKAPGATAKRAPKKSS